MCLYASKFDMVRLDTCLDDMGGFQDSRMYDVIQKHFEKNSTLAPFTGHYFPSCTLALVQCLLIVVSFKIRLIIKLKQNKKSPSTMSFNSCTLAEKTHKPFLNCRYYRKLVATSVKCNIFIDFITSQFRLLLTKSKLTWSKY
jgi:hypothetical protein